MPTDADCGCIVFNSPALLKDEVMDCSRLVEGIGGSTMVIGTRRRFGEVSGSRVDLLASRLSSFYVKIFSDVCRMNEIHGHTFRFSTSINFATLPSSSLAVLLSGSSLRASVKSGSDLANTKTQEDGEHTTLRLNETAQAHTCLSSSEICFHILNTKTQNSATIFLGILISKDMLSLAYF